MDSEANQPFTADDEAELRDALKRCPEAAVEAAVTYRKTGDIEVLPTVIIGIIERFVEPDIRPKLQGDVDDMRVFEDLGIDSLTLMEVVMLVEETLAVTIDNEELRDLRTIGDIKLFIKAKLGGGPMPEKARQITSIEVAELVPQGPPFLFVQDAKVTATGAKGAYQIDGSEAFLEGHFKGNPVFPASLMVEALGQLAIVHMRAGGHASVAREVDPGKILFISCDGVRCTRICKPGDTLSMEVTAKQIKHPMAKYEGTISVGGEKAAYCETFALTFDYQPEAATS